MAKLKVSLSIFFIVLVVSISVLVYFFYSTGGNALIRITQNYLIVNIPNKQYSWKDFTDRGTDYPLSGFYSSSTNNSFSIWTLSGLKTFYDDPGKSHYKFNDICAVINNANQNDKNSAITVDETDTTDFNAWRINIKKEYFMTVSRFIDKPNNVRVLLSVSGIYKILNFVDQNTCK